jgi:hypothetical protein
VPVSRLFLRSEVPLGVVTVPVVSAFLLPTGGPAQEFAASILMIFWLSTCRPQNGQGYPRIPPFLHRIIHSPIHKQAETGTRLRLASRSAARLPGRLPGCPAGGR